MKLKYLIDSTFSRQTTNTVVFWYDRFVYMFWGEDFQYGSGTFRESWSLSYFRRCCREMGFATALNTTKYSDKIILYVDYIGRGKY